MADRACRNIHSPAPHFSLTPVSSNVVSGSNEPLLLVVGPVPGAVCLSQPPSVVRDPSSSAQDTPDNSDSNQSTFLISIYDPPLGPSMTSAHRYPPPPPNSQNDFRLPSLKDLNFYRPSGAQPALPPSQQQDPPTIQPEQPPHPARHPVAWSRSAYQPAQLATPTAHQQYAPAGHEVSPKVEYTPKHENTGYAHPGLPLSVQPNVTSSAGMVPQRNEDASHSPNNQPKRQRTAPSAASRDTRASHPSVYSHPQYSSYPQGSQPSSASQYHSAAPGLPPTPSHATHPPPSSHEQIHHPHPMQVTNHPGYAYPAYVQPRQTLLQPPNSSQISQHNHPNSYPSSAPPPTHAPQPQSPWTQSHPQQPPSQFQQLPPPPTQQHPHPQHNPHPAHASHQHHHQHQPQVSISASSNQPVPAHHHHQQPPPQPPQGPPANPPPSQQIPPSVQYHPHQQYQNQYPHPSQQQQHPQQQQQQQQQQAPASFTRPTAINPTNLENRSTYPVADPPRVPSVQNDAMSEITDHCTILYRFANQYVTLQQNNPHAQPPPAELEEMSQRALKVVRLLDDFRRICIPDSAHLQTPPTVSAEASNSVAPMETDSAESSRPPKRPWEDSQEDAVPPGDPAGFQDQFPANPSPDPRTQTTAEQDMELIRTKRATSTAIANGSSGQPKSKYRKRSMGQRASPPGKCHSCNIRETPEWRRGPDGARTLCNACGLHYAKLMRKQNKSSGNGDSPHIDLETLRASTRAADIAEKGRNTSSKQTESSSSSSKTNGKVQQNSSDTSVEASTTGTATPAPSQTHQGSFQLINMMAPPQENHSSQNHGHGHPPNQSSSSSTVPTPMPGDSRPTSQHASTPQMHAPSLPSSAPSHHPHPHTLHPPHPPWPTTAATTGPAAAASGAVSVSSTASVRNGTSGGSVNGSSFGNPPSQSPVEFIRRQYSLPTRQQPTSR